VANKLVKAIERTPAWQDAFRSSCLQIGFGIKLTRAMVEYLSAVADGVCWDRSKYGAASPYPNNFLATSASLIKRGLIQEKPDSRTKRDMVRQPDHVSFEWTNFELTPAGVHVVELLKLVGLFVEADAAIERKHRTKGG
jgi:hypothetical protein